VRRAWWLPLVAACGGGGSGPQLLACELVAQQPLATCSRAGELIYVNTEANELAGCGHVLGGVHFPDASRESLALIGGVQRIDERLSVFRGDHVDLAPLGGVRLVGGELSVRFADSLSSVDGLGGICEVGALRIEGNDALDDLDGLSGLQRVHGDVEIEGNTRLPSSEIDALLGRIEIGGTVTVADNAD
jgi:hypothetical protein